MKASVEVAAVEEEAGSVEVAAADEEEAAVEEEAGTVEVAAADEEEAVGARAAEVMEAVASALCFLVIWAGALIRGAARFFPGGLLPPSKSVSLPPRMRRTAGSLTRGRRGRRRRRHWRRRCWRRWRRRRRRRRKCNS